MRAPAGAALDRCPPPAPRSLEPIRPACRPNEAALADPGGLPPLVLPPGLAALLAGEAPPALDAAPQHQDRIHLEPNALEAARVAAPHLEQLARLIVPRMPRKLLASSTLRTPDAQSGLLWLDDAIQAQHFAVRTRTHQHAVVIDCDHADWGELLDAMAGHGLPRPTWIAADPWKGTAHLAWWLRDPVCTTERGREAPRRLLDIVAKLLTQALRGDPAYSGSMTKNPWAPGPASTRAGEPAIPALWAAHREMECQPADPPRPPLRYATIPAPALHDLGELRRALLRWQEAAEVPTPGRRRPVVPAQEGERGRRLFDASRHQIYAAWPLSADQVQGIVAEQAAALGSPISDRQRAGMAARMHRWMVRNYRADAGRRRADGSPMQRGRDRLEAASLDLPERQAIAARRTAAGRRQASEAAIREAAARLAAAGRKATVAALAAEAGLSERTLRRIRNQPQDGHQGADRRCASGRAERSEAPAPPQAGPLSNPDISLCPPSPPATPSAIRAQALPPAPAPAPAAALPGAAAVLLRPDAPEASPGPPGRFLVALPGLLEPPALAPPHPPPPGGAAKASVRAKRKSRFREVNPRSANVDEL